MRWIVITAAIIAVLAGTVVAIGFALPEKHTAVRTARYRASPEQVWSAITGISAFPTWRGDVKSVESLPPVDGQPSWRELGSDEAITYRVMTATPPASGAPGRLVTRIADKTLPFGGEWEYEISPDGTGSRLTITERGEVYNPIYRFMSRFVFGHTATLDAYLRNLGSKLGEPMPQGAQGRRLDLYGAVPMGSIDSHTRFTYIGFRLGGHGAVELGRHVQRQFAPARDGHVRQRQTT